MPVAVSVVSGVTNSVIIGATPSAPDPNKPPMTFKPFPDDPVGPLVPIAPGPSPGGVDDVFK